MADEEQLAILRKGVTTWNDWRFKNSEVPVDLTKADLYQAKLTGARLGKADLREADLSRAILSRAYLSKADLSRADLREVDLTEADLSEAKLIGAKLSEAVMEGSDLSKADLRKADMEGAILRRAVLRKTDLSGAKLREADLSGGQLTGATICQAELVRANLQRTVLTDTNLQNADLTGARVYGMSVWNAKLEEAIQKDIVITRDDEPVITVDNLEVAQFIHLLIHNEKIRHVIDTITSKVVLILGRFTEERKAVLDAIRDRLRHIGYTPVLFDFEKPDNRDFTETVRTLAHLARFIVADLTEPRCIPQELQAIVPHLAVPIVPILHKDRAAPGMWKDFYKYRWVLKEYMYRETDKLLRAIDELLIPAALAKIELLHKAIEETENQEWPELDD